MKSTVECATSVLLVFLFSGVAASGDMIRVKQVGSELAPRGQVSTVARALGTLDARVDSPRRGLDKQTYSVYSATHRCML